MLVLDDIRRTLIDCLAILDILKKRDSSIGTAVLYGKIASKLDSVKVLMLEYDHFIRRNNKDKIIDTSLVVIIRFIKFYDIILEKTISYQRNEIGLKEYEVWFSNISKEIINYEKDILDCQELLFNYYKLLMRDRKLESIFEDKVE